MGRSFGYNRNESAEDYRTATELIHLLIDTVSRGGNLLLDIGPTADGRIPEIMEERLLEMGAWLEVNGDAVYGAARWRESSEKSVRYTWKDETLYAISLGWPGTTLELASPEPAGELHVELSGHAGELHAELVNGTLRIQVPTLSVAEIPCRHAWTFRIQGVK